MAEATAMIESKLGKGLKKFLKKNIVKQEVDKQLAVCDKALGGIIKSSLGIDVVYNANTNEIIRGIRSQLHDLVSGLSESETRTMALGLSHSLNRFKLKFSPEKVDIMIVQAIGLLDDLDRELNNFAMRLKEWYGWHFPELAKIVTDNLTFAETIKAIGMRNQVQHTDLSGVLPEDMAAEVKQAAEISMGTDITEEDLKNIFELAERVQELTEYRSSLSDYLKYRMNAIAPNLTHMVGELVGARLISHSGSLMGLAKHPSSTVQILGAEKALFRALKTKSATPKYGLIYHATLVGQTQPKFKGKISRVLAAKLSLCIRVDALGDQTGPTVGLENRAYVERKLEEMQDESIRGTTKSLAKPQIPRYQPNREAVRAATEDTEIATETMKTETKSEVCAEVQGEDTKPEKKKRKAAVTKDGDKPKKKKKSQLAS
eukprot:GHVQ01024947.1.p1 GENE.GHVQ01024947.1~~GHVQ01024947.1.p1  ORF type:complete len:431 (+),score=45.90 GHVQ01024947.1:132-1424(+)